MRLLGRSLLIIYYFLRRKKDIDVINDNDDAIAKMITDMRIAAKEDRELNDLGSPCIKKVGMLREGSIRRPRQKTGLVFQKVPKVRVRKIPPLY